LEIIFFIERSLFSVSGFLVSEFISISFFKVISEIVCCSAPTVFISSFSSFLTSLSLSLSGESKVISVIGSVTRGLVLFYSNFEISINQSD